MSFAQTFNVFQTSNLTAGQKLVLAGIATFANDTGKCWPSIATIADRCSMAGRTVQRHIAKLVRLGYLTRIYRKGQSAITKISTALLEHYAKTNQPTDCTLGDAPIEATGTSKAARVVASTTAPATAAPQNEPRWCDTDNLGKAIQSWGLAGDRLTYDTLSPPPTTPCHPEPAIESVNQTTALSEPPSPEPEPAAAAAVVVFESAIPECSAAPEVPAMPEAPATNPLADVPADLLADFGTVRKAKKKSATITKTEAVVFAAEAQKAGLTVAQAVTTCILRGWSRFEASWIPQQAPTTPPQRYFVPEVAVPASPDVIAAGKAALAALRDRITKQPPKPDLFHLKH